MDVRQVEDEGEVDDALRAERFLLFKHSLICPVSHRAFDEYRAFLEGAPDTPTAWIDVIGQRPLSQHVAARTGIEHASPQAIVIVQGEPVWNASHGAITKDSLAAALAREPSP